MKSLRHRLRKSRGLVLPATLIIVAVTSLLAVPLMGYLSSVLHHGGSLNAKLDSAYTNDAGTADSMYRLANDQSFVSGLSTSGTQTYTLTLNGQTVTVTVQLYNNNDPTPTPVPTPSYFGQGVHPLEWTFMQPSSVNLAKDPTGKTRLTIYIANAGGSTISVSEITDLLPLHYVYAGNLASVGFQDNHGNTFAIPAPTVTDPPWSYTGADPYNNCNLKTATQVTGQKRMDWSWSGGGSDSPRVPKGTIATISFDITLSGVYIAGTYLDSPWLSTDQQQCSNQMQAGAASSILVDYTALVTSHSGSTTLSSLVTIKPGSHKIQAELNHQDSN